MKLYLFGGAEIDQNPNRLKEQINEVLKEVKPKQLLHVPYARVVVPEGEEDIWSEGWVKRDLNLEGIELLDARNEDDLNKADNPLILINGGKQRDHVYEKIIGNKKLYDLVMNASVLIGESAGSMVCGEFRRTYRRGKAVAVRGLGILKSTIIEGHYSQRNRQGSLRSEMKERKLEYGIGIDSFTAAVLDTDIYPKGVDKIGDGMVDFVKFEDLNE